MKARVLVVASLLPLLATGLVVSSALAGDRGSSGQMQRLRGVNFVSSCTFSHGAPDDPIVFLGLPVHHHSFVGNTGTNASSTPESLLAAGTTCHRPGDTAAYWMPTLLVNGQPVAPNHAQIYYRRTTMRHVEAFPTGFRIVAGDAKATSPQAQRVTFWNCGVLGGFRGRAPCRRARTRDARLYASISRSRAAGTAKISTAPVTRAASSIRFGGRRQCLRRSVPALAGRGGAGQRQGAKEESPRNATCNGYSRAPTHSPLSLVAASKTSPERRVTSAARDRRRGPARARHAFRTNPQGGKGSCSKVLTPGQARGRHSPVRPQDFTGPASATPINRIGRPAPMATSFCARGVLTCRPDSILVGARHHTRRPARGRDPLSVGAGGRPRRPRGASLREGMACGD